MPVLFSIFILGFITIAQGEHTQYLVSQLSTHLIGPSFFQNVTTDAKISFYKVLDNKTLTRNQQREQLIKWGADNEVEADVRGYVEKQSRSLHEFREHISLFLMQLLNYEKEIDSIYFDDNITVEQREHLLFTLDCPTPMKKILAYAATMVKRYGLPKPKRTSRSPTTTAYRGAPTVATTTTKPPAENNNNTTTTAQPTTGSANGTITTATTAAGNGTVIPTTGSNNTAATTTTVVPTTATATRINVTIINVGATTTTTRVAGNVTTTSTANTTTTTVIPSTTSTVRVTPAAVPAAHPAVAAARHTK